jgi:hypothetical protein
VKSSWASNPVANYKIVGIVHGKNSQFREFPMELDLPSLARNRGFEANSALYIHPRISTIRQPQTHRKGSIWWSKSSVGGQLDRRQKDPKVPNTVKSRQRSQTMRREAPRADAAEAASREARLFGGIANGDPTWSERTG